MTIFLMTRSLLLTIIICLLGAYQYTKADGCTGSTFDIQYSPACNCWQVCGNYISDCEEIKSIDWDFGDGTTASGSDPCHTYTQPGTYTVTMNIKACCHGFDPIFPCSNIMNCQITNTVVVTQDQIDNNGPQADFTADTVCLGQETTFTNQSQFANDFTWIFPNGSTSNAANPTYEFDSCGVYEQDIALVASDNTCCPSPSYDTITKPVYVKCPPNTPSNANADTSDYIYESYAEIIEDTVCHQEPMPFDLSKSNNVIDWQWSFSDGGTSSNLTPQHVFDDCGANAQPPNYAEVAFTNTHGCIDTVREYVEVFCPIQFSGQVTNQGCTQKGSIVLNFQGSSAALEYSNDCGNTFQTDPNYWYPVSPGDYCVVVRDTHQVCQATDTFTVGLDGGPNISAIDSMNPSCTGGPNSGYIDITVSGGASPLTYQWSNGANTEDITNLPTGTYTVTVTDANNCTDEATVTLEPYSGSLAISKGCHGANNGAIDLTVTGGSPPYNYNWSNSDITQDISNLSPGTYSVTVTDDQGCTLVLDTTITQPPPLQYDFSISQYGAGYNISCHDSSDGWIDLTVNGGTPPYSYNWNAGISNSQDLNDIPAGNYFLTITDDNGCTLTADTVLYEPPPLPTGLTVSNYNGYNVSCNGASDGFVDLSVNSGGASLNYSWSNGSSSQDLSGVPAGSYSVTVSTGSGCSNAIDTTLEEPPPLQISATLSEYIGGYNVSCHGASDGSIDVTVSGGTPPYSYSWNGGANFNQDLVNIPAGSYSLTVTDTNGCTLTFDTTLTEPQPLTDSLVISEYPSGDNISCYGADDGSISVMDVNGGTSPYGYFYQSGQDTNSSLSPDTNNLQPGNYTVVVGDQNGCTIEHDTFLTEPSPLNIDLTISSYPSGDNVSCQGASDGAIDLSVFGGSPGYDYNWSTGDTTQDLDSIPAGQYSVTVTDTNGCVITGDTTLTDPPPLQISATLSQYAGGYNVSCYGASDGSIDVTVSGGSTPYTYSWNGGAYTSQDLTNIPADSFNVLVTDNNGCTISLDTALTEPPPLEDSMSLSTYIGGENVSCFGASDGSIDLTVNGGVSSYSYSWNSGAYSSADLNNITAGNYTVTVTDQNGCTLIDDTTLTEPPPLTSSLIVPSYAGDDNVSCNGASDGSIDLTVNGGTQGYAYNWSPGGNATQDLDSIPAGPYSVTVTDTNGCVTTRDTTLTEPPPLQIAATLSQYAGGYNVSCHGASDGSIDVTVNGGTTPYTYSWNSGAYTSEDLTNVPADTFNLVVTDANGCAITLDTVLTEPPPIEDSISISSYIGGDNVSCYGASDGSIDLTVNGGVSPYIYSWNGGTDSTQDLTNITAGNYTVTVIDQNGCTLIDDTTLTEPPPLTTSFTVPSYAGDDNVSCYGASDGSIDLTVNGGTQGYDYNWSPNGNTTQDLDSIPAGQYSVTVTDTNGCTTTRDTTLTEPPALQISATLSEYVGGHNVSCFGASDGSIDLTVSGGTTPYTYSWNGGAYTSEDLTNIPADTYDVVVTDANGCSITLDTVLSEPQPLGSSWTTSEYTGGWQVSCHGASDGSIDLTVNGGVTPYSYSWNGGSYDTEDLANLPAGNYSVTVTDTNGCTIALDTTLTEPPPFNTSASLSSFQGGHNISCFGFSDGLINLEVNGATPPYSYSWNTGDTSQDLFNISAGSYTVTITDTNGCTTIFDTTLTQPDPLGTKIATSSYEDGHGVSCNGFEDGWIDLTVSGGSEPYTYQWNNGLAAKEDLDSIGAGTYNVEIIDANGCIIRDSVSLSEPPPIAASLQSEDITCYEGKDGYLSVEPQGGTEPYEIQWSNGQAGNAATSLPAGDYSTTVSDANNCQTQLQETLYQPGPVEITAPAKYKIRFGDTVQISTQSSTNGKDVSSYSWMPETALSCTDCANPEASPLESRTYTVTMVDEDGCYDTAKTKVVVDDTKIMFTPNAFSPNNDEVNDEFKVNVKGVKTFEMKIFNRWGEKIFESHDKTNGWDGTYQDEPCRPGVFVYMVRVTYLDGKTEERSGSVTLIR